MKFYTETQKPQTKWLTILAIVCSIGVLMLHANAAFWHVDVRSNDFIWLSVVESLFYCCVPCFFMISGMTLIDYKKRYNLKTYAKKRVIKTLIPYLAWTFIGLGIEIGLGLLNPSQINFLFILSSIFSGSQIVSIYWFFPLLFLLYGWIALLALIPDKRKDFWLLIIVICCFVICCVIPFIVDASLGGNLRADFRIFLYTQFFYPLMYACIGYLINKYELHKYLKIAIYVLSVIGLFAIYGGTILMSRSKGINIRLFKDYGNWTACFYSLGVALFFKDVVSKLMNHNKVEKVCNKFQKHTFAIYLIHIYFIQILQIYMYQNCCGIPNSSPIFIFTVAFLVVPMCVATSHIFKKIPIVKYLLP